MNPYNPDEQVQFRQCLWDLVQLLIAVYMKPSVVRHISWRNGGWVELSLLPDNLSLDLISF